MTTAALHPEAKAETTGLKGLRQRLDAGNGLLPYGLVAPVLIVILLVAVFPILDAIRLSLLDNPLIASGSDFVGLRNYIQVIGDPQFRGSIFWTIAFSVISVALETFFGLLIALLFRALDAIRVFDLFYILAGNQVQTMATYSYNKMFTGTTFDFAPGIAASVILAIFATVVAIIFVYWMGGISRQE